jgi:hypothetical protein
VVSAITVKENQKLGRKPGFAAAPITVESAKFG